jgi:hypothetical protein
MRSLAEILPARAGRLQDKQTREIGFGESLRLGRCPCSAWLKGSSRQ